MTDIPTSILAAQRADALLAQVKFERRMDYLERVIQLLREDFDAHAETVSESLGGLVAEMEKLRAHAAKPARRRVHINREGRKKIAEVSILYREILIRHHGSYQRILEIINRREIQRRKNHALLARWKLIKIILIDCDC